MGDLLLAVGSHYNNPCSSRALEVPVKDNLEKDDLDAARCVFNGVVLSIPLWIGIALIAYLIFNCLGIRHE